MVRLLVFAVASFLMGGVPITFGEEPLPEGVELRRDLPYVTEGGARQQLDLYYRPGSGKCPLVIWIHGGGWEGGSKEAPGAQQLLVHGDFALASINYRLTRQAAFPAQIEDCKSAVRWLRAHADEYGLDGERFAVWGASAGGHLASLVGTSGDTDSFDVGDHLDQSSAVQAVVNFCGPSDLMLYRRSYPGDTLSRLIGGPIETLPEVVRQANPCTYASAQDPPFLIVHGAADFIVPLIHSEVLEETLRTAGVPVTLDVVPRTGHSVGTPNTINEAIDFLKTTLARKTSPQSEEKSGEVVPMAAAE